MKLEFDEAEAAQECFQRASSPALSAEAALLNLADFVNPFLRQKMQEGLSFQAALKLLGATPESYHAVVDDVEFRAKQEIMPYIKAAHPSNDAQLPASVAIDHALTILAYWGIDPKDQDRVTSKLEIDQNTYQIFKDDLAAFLKRELFSERGFTLKPPLLVA